MSYKENKIWFSLSRCNAGIARSAARFIRSLSFLSLLVCAPAVFATNESVVLDFDGVDDYLVIQSGNATVFTSDMTVEVWVKTTATPSGSVYIAKAESRRSSYSPGYSSSAYWNWAISMNASGYPVVFTTVGGGGRTLSYSNPINDGEWHHIAMVRTNSRELFLYVDGVLRASGSITYPGFSVFAAYDLYIGSGAYFLGYSTNETRPRDYFPGQISDFRIWEDIRTASEIQTTKDSTLTGSEDNLRAWFRLNDGSAGGSNLGVTRANDSITSASATWNNAAKTGSSSNFVGFSGDIAQPDPGLTLASRAGRVGGPSFSMIATTLSPSAVSYSSSDTDVATIDSSTGAVTVVGAGSTIITATQGAATYYAADTATATLTINASNTTPTLANIYGFTVSEDVETNFRFGGAATVVDGDDDPITVTVEVSAGTLATPVDDAALVESKISDSKITLYGTAAAINSYLRVSGNLKYTSAANVNGLAAATADVTANDSTVDSSTTTVNINISAVNDAPVLDTSTAYSLPTIAEEVSNASNTGALVENIVSGLISDVDGSAVNAIAITELDNTNGVWQYNLEVSGFVNSSNWENISDTTGAVVDLEAAGLSRLFSGTTSAGHRYVLRFNPVTDFSGTSTFKYRAWDKTSGSDGNRVSTSTNGGTTAFSSEEESVSVTVTEVNDAPVFYVGVSATGYVEDTQSRLIRTGISLSDDEDDSLTLAGTVSAGTIDSVADGSGVGDGVVATRVSATQFTVQGSAADIVTYASNSENIQYTPPLNYSGDDITLSFSATDGLLTSATSTLTLRITGVNDAPVLDPSARDASKMVLNTASSAAGTEYVLAENPGIVSTLIIGTSYGSIASTTDADAGSNLRGIAVVEVDNTNGFWEYSTNVGNLSGSSQKYVRNWSRFSSSTGVVDLTSQARLIRYDDTHSAYAYIRFVPNSTYSGTATLKFRAWDGTDGKSPGYIANTGTNGGATAYSTATDTLTYIVVAAPAVANLEGDIARYVDGGGDVFLDVGSDAILSDDDDARGWYRLAVSRSSFVTGDEYDIKSDGDITLSGSSSGSTLSIGGRVVGNLRTNLPSGSGLTIDFAADATTSEVQTVLRHLVYRNTDTGSKTYSGRDVTITISDRDGNSAAKAMSVREANGYLEGNVTAGAFDESSVVLPTSADTAAEAVTVLDFTLSDSGATDSLALDIDRIRLQLSGTMPRSEYIQLKFILTGPDVASKVGYWASGGISDAGIYFASLPIVVANGTSETYSIKVYRDPAQSLTDGSRLVLTIDGDDPTWLIDNTKSEMGVTTAVTNGSGFTVDAVSDGMRFTTLPATVTLGATFTTVVKAVDSGGSVDTGFTEDVTISATGSGTLSGTTTVTAVAGVATFSDLVYSAAADGETFTLTANDESDAPDLPAAVSSAVTANVVATKLLFTRQPTPRAAVSGINLNFDDSAQMIVAAVDANNVVDTGFTGFITLQVVNGAGASVLGVTGSSGSAISKKAIAGIASSWPSGYLRYTNAVSTKGTSETFNIRATASGLTLALSEQFSSVVAETTGKATSAAALVEPVVLSTAATSVATAVPVFDFTLSDGGGVTSDGLSYSLGTLRVFDAGTLTAAERAKIRLVLNGPDVTDLVASYSSSRWSFPVSIEIADKASEVYTVSAYFSGGGVESGKTFRPYLTSSSLLSVEGGTTTGSFATLYSDSVGSTVRVTGTRLVFSTSPSGSVSGSALATQPVVQAVDDAGNIDTSFTEVVTVRKKSGLGTLSGTLTATAVAGVATFTDLVYSATADGEAFELTADDEATGTDFTAVDSGSITSDVVATKLVFDTEPAPTSFYADVDNSFTTDPVVRALDAADKLDTDFTSAVVLTEELGSGTVAMSATGDTDSDAATVTLAAVGGVTSFADLALAYTASAAADETFVLRASSGALTTADSATLTARLTNTDGVLAAASGVSEPTVLDSTIDTVGEATEVFDFTLTDGGGDDGLGIKVSALNIRVGGSSSDSQRAKVTWRLNGPGVSNAIGTYDAVSDRIAFTGLGIDIASGASATYTLNAFYNSNVGLTDHATFVLSITGTTDITLIGTRIGSATPVTGTVSTQIVSTALTFTAMPAGTTAGIPFSTQPVVSAVDAFGNVDKDFTETITLTESSAGVLDGDIDVAAVAGVATFTGISHKPLTDGETLSIVADDIDDITLGTLSDLAAITATTITSNVVATKLVFDTQPAPLTVISAQEQVATTVPVIHALNADDVLDTGFTASVTLAEQLGAGTATLSATSDTDGSAATVSRPAVGGIATFTGLKINYSVSALIDETFALRASSGALSTVDSAMITAVVPNGDARLTAAAGVTEPVALGSTIDTLAEAIGVLDFTLVDGGGDDGLGVSVSALNIQVGGTSSDTLRGQVTWILNGPGVAGVVGTFDAANDLIAFTGLGIDVASAGSATYTLSAFYNDNTALTEGKTFELSITGNTDLTFLGTTVGSSTAVTGTTSVDVVATKLAFTTMPAGTTAGAAFSTQPVVSAVDEFGNVDVDFTETVTLSESSAGSLAGDIDVAAVAGVATFTGVSHKPAADGEAIAIAADDESDLSVGTRSDLATVTATSITSDAVATKLVFLDEPTPLNLVKARATSLARVPRVGAVNADGVVDTDRTGTVVLTMVDSAGTIEMSATGDTDGDPGGAKTSITLPLVAGVASFADMTIKYTNSGLVNETFKLQASHTTAPTLATATTVKSAEMRGVVADTDGNVTAAGGVSEPVTLSTTVGSTATPVALFDFTLSDGATVDSLPLEVTAIAINISGTTDDTLRGQIDWLLDGPDATAVAGVYDAATDKINFTALNISVASGASEDYTLSARFNTVTNVTDGQTLIFTLDGVSDVTLSGSGTQFATTTAITNGTGTVVEVRATQLVFSQQPAGSASGSALTTQPIVQARDAAGNLDLDFTEVVSLSSTGSLGGSLGGSLAIAASAGTATFTDVFFTATSDKQTFSVVANDDDGLGGDLPSIASAAVISEVTATSLAFLVEPSPSSLTTGQFAILSGGPRVGAVDSRGVVDTDYVASVRIQETAGAGSAVFELAADTDLDENSVTVPMVAGVASFDGLRITYTTSVDGVEVFYLNATAAGFTAVRSIEMSASPVPPPPPDTTIKDKTDATGRTVTDPKIGEGGTLTGGTVCGDAKSTGLITGVKLCAGATIEGGEIGGAITGDPDSPARIDSATILPGTTLKNVRIGADVILLKGVILGVNVGFDSLINVPAGVMLTDTLNKIAVPGATGGDERIALDLRSTPMPGAAAAPRTSYLELVKETPEFNGTGARLEQEVTGEVKMEFPTSQARMLPIGMRKTEDGANGFFYDDDGNLSIRMGINLEIIMYPMFVDETAVSDEIRRYDQRYAISYDEDSNFIITRDEKQGAEATLPRYIGRPGISAFRAVRDREPGFVFYPSPWLKNLQQVSLITRGDSGVMLEQELVPVPKDWFEFKAQLQSNPDVQYVRINSQGVITLGYRGEEYQLLASYDTMPNTVVAIEGREIVFVEAGDLNDDGEMDYYSYYANGDRQTLYTLP